MENLQNDVRCLRRKPKVDYKSLHSGRQSMQNRKNEGVAQSFTGQIPHWLESSDIPPSQAFVILDRIEIINFDSVVATEKAEPEEERIEVNSEAVEKEPILEISTQKHDAAIEEKPVKVEKNKNKSSSKSSRSSRSSGCDRDEEGIEENKDEDEGKNEVKEKGGNLRKERNKDSKENDKDKNEVNEGKHQDKDTNKKKDIKSSRCSSFREHRSNRSTERRSKIENNKNKCGKDEYEDTCKGMSNEVLKSSSSANSEKCEESKMDVAKQGKKKSKYEDENEYVSKNELVKREERAMKDKLTLSSINLPSIRQLGRIPKKSISVAVAPAPSEEKMEETKKNVFAVEIGKDKHKKERPGTVKVFSVKRRSTGLEEDVKPLAKPFQKPTASLHLPKKRPSSPEDPIVPPTKQIKLDEGGLPERPSAIINPRNPKKSFLRESESFMKAIAPEEPEKRKRSTSMTRKAHLNSPSLSKNEPEFLNPPTQTHLCLENIAPINFYQDTLTGEEEQKPDTSKMAKAGEVQSAVDVRSRKEAGLLNGLPQTPADENQVGIKKSCKRIEGILKNWNRNGPKRSISWRNDTDLVEIRYFQLDETERVNVTKSFRELARSDATNERKVLHLSREIGREDLLKEKMECQTSFHKEQKKSSMMSKFERLEEDIQFTKKNGGSLGLKGQIPDSPEEPEPDNDETCAPILIPLEDPNGQVKEWRGTPWPEPKGMSVMPLMQIILPNMQGQCNPQFNFQFNVPTPDFRSISRPFAVPDKPFAVPDRPFEISDRPFAVPDRPFAIPDRPFAIPDRLFAVPGRPFEIPDRPFALPDKPFALPDRPFALPDGPFALPDRPFAIPDRPFAVRDRPFTVRDRPFAVMSPNVMPAGIIRHQNYPNRLDMPPPNGMIMNQNVFSPSQINDNLLKGPNFRLFPNGPPNHFQNKRLSKKRGGKRLQMNGGARRRGGGCKNMYNIA